MVGTVLVMTDAEDYTSDLVVSALQERGMTVVRLDPGAGPIRMEVTLARSGWRDSVGDEHRVIDLREVVSVLWRWPTPPAGNPDITDLARREWAAREDTAALYGVLKTLPVRWVNHPDRREAANSKPGQLIVAAASGFAVPDTILTTRGDAVRAWAHGRDVLYKAFYAQAADENEMVIATRVRSADLPTELGAASTFQEIIVGQSIRVTVIGEQTFAVAISGTDELDWRPVSNQLTFSPIQVPQEVVTRIHAFMRHYGLEYGAMDFIRSAATEQWIFLENNPSGMYGFVEIQSGLEITAAIADRLCLPLESSSPVTSTVGW